MEDQNKETITVNNLTNELKEKILNVQFTKKDGTKRTMKCTLNESYLPIQESEKTNPKPAGLVTVWDIEADNWRSFYTDAIIDINEAPLTDTK